MKVQDIKDYTEKTWFLGTDILEKRDLELMLEEVETSLCRAEGAMYHVSDEECIRNDYATNGYSLIFCEIVEEAYRRGYFWLFFDCDIETKEILRLGRQKTIPVKKKL